MIETSHSKDEYLVEMLSHIQTEGDRIPLISNYFLTDYLLVKPLEIEMDMVIDLIRALCHWCVSNDMTMSRLVMK